MNSPSTTSTPGLSIPAQGYEAVNYDAPTPETDRFMLRIDDSTIDLGQVESALSDMECERDAARRERKCLREVMERICNLVLDPWTKDYSLKRHIRRQQSLLTATQRGRALLEPHNEKDEHRA